MNTLLSVVVGLGTGIVGVTVIALFIWLCTILGRFVQELFKEKRQDSFGDFAVGFMANAFLFFVSLIAWGVGRAVLGALGAF